MKNELDDDLLVKYEFKNFHNKLTIHCPDEDSEIRIEVADGRKVGYNLTLSEAKDLAKKLTAYVRNEKKCLSQLTQLTKTK